MRGKAVLVLPLAVLLTHGFSARAGEPEPDSLPDITKEDLKNIADRLKDLAATNVVEEVLGDVEGGNGDVDSVFVQKALESLSELVSKSESTALLEELQSATEGTVREILKSEAADMDDPVETILNYFLSLRRVLSGNDYLRGQVTALLQKNAKELLNSNSLVDVLKDIMTSTVFKDLEEEIREDMQTNAGYLIAPSDDGGDMSR